MSEDLVNQPKTKRGQITLDKLIDSAEENFSKLGYHRTSIVDITRSAGVALGTYYVYFADKISIYRYLLLNYSHEIRKNIALEIKKAENRKDAERLGLKAFLQYISDNKHIYNIIWESLYIDKSLFIDYYTKFALSYRAQIEKAQDAGEMKEFDPEVASYMLMGISNFIGLNWIMFKDENDFDKIVDEVINILDKGMFK